MNSNFLAQNKAYNNNDVNAECCRVSRKFFDAFEIWIAMDCSFEGFNLMSKKGLESITSYCIRRFSQVWLNWRLFID